MQGMNSNNTFTGRLRRVVYDLGDARARIQVLLYGLLLLALGLYVLVAICFTLEAVVPQWSWLPTIIEAFVPGLPLRILDFAAAYPWQVVVVVLLVWAIRRAALAVGRSQAEFAYQVWAGVVPNYRVRMGTRILLKITPPRWLTYVTASVLVAYALADLPGRGAVDVVRQSDPDPIAACAEVGGRLCRLGDGESVLISIRADDPHNRSGILLDACGTYDAAYVSVRGWRDREMHVPAEGFVFGDNLLGLRRFLWVEWRRPFPQGKWFQVVGRIDRRNPIFRILDARHALNEFEFSPPHSGELVLLVNDVIYDNNQGVMVIRIRKIDSSACESGD